MNAVKPAALMVLAAMMLSTSAATEEANLDLEGEVRDAAGKPAAGVPVAAVFVPREAVSPLALQGRTSQTGADGRFVLSRLIAGKYAVVAKSDTLGEATTSVELPYRGRLVLKCLFRRIVIARSDPS